MISDESGPTPFDDRPHRRSGERRLEALANNALLKVLQFAVTSIAVPLLGWGASTLGKIQEQMQLQEKVGAITELRLLANEKTVAELSAQNQNLRERVLSLEFQARVTPNQKGTP